MRVTHLIVGSFAAILTACTSSTAPNPAGNATGSSSGTGAIGGISGSVSADTIKVGKHYWVASNHTLLVSASSSDPSAHLYLSTPSGTRLGEVQNGSAGRYGGTVFFSMTDPGSLTITSTSGGTITVETLPFQP